MSALSLPAICDRSAARAFHTELSEAIGPEKVTVDASAVERIGQPMLQLLVSASKTESGIALSKPSEALTTALELSGLQSAFAATSPEGPAQ
jgi:anti-anti-sigma regulatory factor